ncbi:hypothetical protein [Xenorhabdus koppenhoeferi]|uniref:Uncharacterized protein n=1 Tax=Xenorhabdus koppenhoeferi TaxID=351659 RepID=A0A1I7K6I8_9GAMM|nr:hypothetical protein [Xenorhabdus koppenhoeferi]SFU93055.1 hypothetical protein SAMN05421784_14810 [Xenorhabdus koppenhoeferi]
MEYELIEGTFSGTQEHPIDDPILDKAVAALEGDSIKFSLDVIMMPMSDKAILQILKE